MIAAAVRKARRLADDPVLRRWLLSQSWRKRHQQAFEAHRPPYLQGHLPLGHEAVPPATAASFRTLDGGSPQRPVELPLPGETIRLHPGEAGLLFDRPYSDIETQLAVYRFAWLPLLAGSIEEAWTEALWREFEKRFSSPDDSWAWHPYTAAERAINLLDYSAQHGLPGSRNDTLALLNRHVSAIAARLEYFGDHNTSNHLSNNGRGLYRIGLDLGLPAASEIGHRILLAEADRIFRPSGVLREGSTHYHLLLARNYIDAFLAARSQGRPETESFGEIARRALAVLSQLVLPGGLPLVGDISPDCPPAFLACLLPEGDLHSGWAARLSSADRWAVKALRDGAPAVSVDQLASDGWVRFSAGEWSALWHVAPTGWTPAAGHAHQDIGSFEAHWGAMPLFVDPGRGAYGETGEAGFFTSALAHNTLTVAGHDPYPPNKPYYDEEFRRSICGPRPHIQRRDEGVSIFFDGFRRVAGAGRVERSFRFRRDTLTIIDTVEGTARLPVARRLYTPWPTALLEGQAVISTPSGPFQVEAESPLVVTATKRWTAYGVAEPAFLIEATADVPLPTCLTLQVKRAGTER